MTNYRPTSDDRAGITDPSRARTDHRAGRFDSTRARPEIRGTMHHRFADILTDDALAFIADLDGAFAGRRADLLAARRDRARRISAGDDLTFLPETAAIRSDTCWRVADPAPGLDCRHVEITGPATRKMTVSALNSGADVWMADLEDATAPTWFNIVDSQVNLYDAIRRQIDFVDDRGKSYAVGDVTPMVMMRPRGWHLCEKHLTIDARPLSASLVDFGLYFFHNAKALIASGAGPYFYLPKIESHLEARLWNDIFLRAEEQLGIPRGSIRATVLIETLPAALEMDEILYELREHSAGLNAGRWDYIFSFIRTFAERGADFVLPDRTTVTMTTPFLRAYTESLVATCHRRGAHAIGGMAAFVPDKSDAAATERALAQVRGDKDREAADGFDGSWVAHPALVDTCRSAFRAVLGDRPDQRDRRRPGIVVTAKDLTSIRAAATGVTLAGVHTNISAALRYLARWASGTGSVAIDALMEDAATVEISRAQLWQWITCRARLDDGRTVTRDLVRRLIDAEAMRLRTAEWATDAQIDAAVDVLGYAALGEKLPGFFTPYAYVRYLTEKPLRLAGPLTPDDLRQSERVPARPADARRSVPLLV